MPQVIITAGLCVLGLMLTVEAHRGGTEIQFQATPKFLKRSLTRQVSMRCAGAEHHGGSPSSGKELDEVTKILVTLQNELEGDQYVAVVTTHQPAASHVHRGGLRVEGSVAGLGYLQLTWDQPFQMSMGTYKCVIHGKSKSNRSVMLSKTLWLATKRPTMNDLLKRINDNEHDRQEADKKLDEAFKAQTEGGVSTAALNTALAHINEIEHHSNEADMKHDEAIMKLDEEIKKDVEAGKEQLKRIFEFEQNSNEADMKHDEAIMKLDEEIKKDVEAGKEQMAALEQKLKADEAVVMKAISDLRSELKADEAVFKKTISDLRSELSKMKDQGCGAR